MYLCSDKDNNLVEIYESIASAARSHAINSEGVRMCIAGKKKTAAGFIWKKLDKDTVV